MPPQVPILLGGSPRSTRWPLQSPLARCKFGSLRRKELKGDKGVTPLLIASTEANRRPSCIRAQTLVSTQVLNSMTLRKCELTQLMPLRDIGLPSEPAQGAADNVAMDVRKTSDSHQVHTSSGMLRQCIHRGFLEDVEQIGRFL